MAMKTQKRPIPKLAKYQATQVRALRYEQKKEYT